MKLNKNLKLRNLVLRALNSPYREKGGVFFADNKNILFIYHRLTGYNIPKNIVKTLLVAGLIKIQKGSGLIKDKYVITERGVCSMSKPDYSQKDKKWWRKKLLEIGGNLQKGYIGVDTNSIWEVGYTDAVAFPKKVLKKLIEKGKLVRLNHFYLTPEVIKDIDKNRSLSLEDGVFYPHMMNVRIKNPINPTKDFSTVNEDLEVIKVVKKRNKPPVTIYKKKEKFSPLKKKSKPKKKKKKKLSFPKLSIKR